MASRARNPLFTAVAGVAVAAGAVAAGAYLLKPKKDTLDGEADFLNLAADFDVVIVGSGSAGSVLAARLSEDPNVKVLLLEAGSDNRSWHIECGWECMSIQLGTWDWCFKSTPQAATNGRVHNWPRGLTLGGCSSTNAVLYVRAAPGDYERWEHGLGCSGWGWEDMERCFKKSERFYPASLASAEMSHHGKDGFLGVTQLSSESAQKFTTDAINSCVNSGEFKFNPDYNGTDNRGVSFSQLTVENGVRSDAFNGFLRRTVDGKRALDRPNLTVLRNAYVTKVEIDDSKRATGVRVRFSRDHGGFEKLALGKEYLIPAKREVILSAGAVNSPWLLQLSGVGPKAVLKKAGIPVKVANEAVGQGLKDHLMVPISVEIDDNTGMTAAPTLTMVSRLLRYLLFRTGPLTTGFIESMAFTDSGLTDEDPEIKWRKRPDTQVHMTPTFAGAPSPAASATGITPFLDNPEMYGFTFLPSLLVPRSVGTVEVQSTDPAVRPIVDPHYLEHPEDVEILKRAIRKVYKVIEAEPFKTLIKKVHFRSSHLAAHHNDHTSDAFIEQIIRDHCITIYHPTSTVKIGPDSDQSAAADLRCNVRGVTGLRVVDASSFPDLVSGNTNAPAIAFAERAAELIKEDWSKN
ncbi:hypothetical protein DFJ74DRAFT_652449 [Hyaloraphidium curvatum]|nr:hypothetical protein DFJ74DRAFT_652449 [Hyaloraphidium curvatum]